MSNKNIAILMVITAIVSAGITRYYFPQLEYKNTETVKEVVKNDIKVIERTIERPDGTKETTRETIDKSVKKETSTSETLIASKNQWMFDIGARANIDRDVYYDLQAQRRILGPFFLGARISTDKTAGVSLGMEF